MSIQTSQFHCTLCDHTFKAHGESEPRCPRCLRSTGVTPIHVEIELPQPKSPSRNEDDGYPRSKALLVMVVALLLGIGLGFWLISQRTPNPWQEPRHALLSLGIEDFLQLPDSVQFVGLDELDEVLEENGIRHVRDGESPARGAMDSWFDSGGAPLCEIQATRLGLALLGPAVEGTTPCTVEVDLATAFVERPFGICAKNEEECSWLWRPFSRSTREPAICMAPLDFAAAWTALRGELATDPAAAYEWFDRALMLASSPSIQFALGMTKIRFGASEFGVDDLRKALNEESSVAAAVKLGDVLLGDLGRTDDALQRYLAVLEMDDTNVPARKGIVQAFLWKDNLEKARPHLDWLEEHAPTEPGVQASAAQYWTRKGDTDKARKALEKEVEHNPALPAILWLAEMIRNEDGVGSAVAFLKKKQSETGDLRYAHKGAFLLHEAERNDEAIEMLTALVKAHPKDGDSLRLLASLHLKLRHFPEALRWAESTLQVLPESKEMLLVRSLTQLSLSHEQQFDPQEAKRVGEAALKAHSELAMPLSQQLFEKGYPEDGAWVLEASLEFHPGDVDLMASLYAWYLGSNQSDKAKGLEDQARELDASDQEAFRQLTEQIDKVRKLRHGKGAGTETHLPDEESLTGEE